MTQYRVPTINSKYYVERELFLTTVHFCLQYPTWIAELSVEPDASKAITYDKERVQSSNTTDPTSSIAMRRAEIARKAKLVEDTAAEAASNEHNSQWIILGACYGLNVYQLKNRGMLLPEKTYYLLRRRFYHLLSQRI